jgi:hypothetical protein
MISAFVKASYELNPGLHKSRKFVFVIIDQFIYTLMMQREKVRWCQRVIKEINGVKADQELIIR